MPSGRSDLANRGRPAYPLSQQQVEFLRTGDSGTYRPSNLETDIEDKVDELPERLETLFLDIELLYEEGYLNPDTWGAPWMRWHFGEQSTRRELADAYPSSPEDFTESLPTNLGQRLGQLARRLVLLPDPDNQEEQDVMQDLIWGFISGVCFDHRRAGDVSGEFRKAHTDEILEGIRKRAATAAADDDARHKRMAEQTLKTQIQREGTRQRIETLLEAHGVEPGDWVVDKIREHIWDRYSDTDLISGASYSDDWSPTDHITEELVADIVETDRLVEKQQIRTYLAEDAERIDGRSWRGVETSLLCRTTERPDNETLNG